ncbi:MAG: oxidase [Verrucomicrobiota bacterium JB022]|nr:oxidase [Verrucomicrobiota bacterium JB022]
MSHPEEESPSNGLLLLVLAGLMMLLVVAFSLIWVPHGWWSPVLAMTVAAAKALLIIVYFMRARYHDRSSWLFIFGGLFWLGILFTLTFADYLTR